jgi:HAD superfamily hydrolase (TIGR01459 family)
MSKPSSPSRAADPFQPRAIAGLRDIVADHDGYIVDLWGTLHDGIKPIPGAVDCLAALKAAGKRICLLSNAPRRIQSVTARLDEMGVPRDVYDFVLSSGEAAHLALAERKDPERGDPWHARLGNRCYHLGPPRDNDVRDGIGLEIVDRVGDADFILATGIDEWDETVEQHAPTLETGARHRIPLICANPDLVVMVGDRRSICAGTLAAQYEALGGDVFYHGKPHASVYKTCFAWLGIQDRSRLIGIGDSLRTDVAGANAAGIASMLLTGEGIHAEEFALTPGGPADAGRLAAAYERERQVPTYVAPGLIW